jgi:NAD+ kinase
LTHRPIVESSERTFGIRLGSGAVQAVAVVDGQAVATITARHRITIRKAPVTFQLVKVPGRTYYQTLREKLRWGTPPGYNGSRDDGA